jgi:putative hydrolases of HD superfamily
MLPRLLLLFVLAVTSAVAQDSGETLGSFLLSPSREGDPLFEKIRNGLRLQKRAGWVLRGVRDIHMENVLQHTLKVREAAWVYLQKNSPELDRKKVLSMSLIHDIPEYITPDLPPNSGISAAEKYRIEKAVMVDLADRHVYFRKVLPLWEEFEENESPEAILVKDLDRMDAAIQGLVYEQMGYDVRSVEPGIFVYPFEKVRTPMLLNILRILLKKEFSSPPYEQYHWLLWLQGDEAKFRAVFGACGETLKSGT